MAVKKGVSGFSYKAGGTIGQYEPVKLGSGANEVIVPTAVTDIVVGVSQIDAVAGGEISVADKVIVLMRVGSAGVTKGDPITLDSTDKTEIATLTKGTTSIRQLIGYAEATGVENEYIPVRLQLGDTLI